MTTTASPSGSILRDLGRNAAGFRSHLVSWRGEFFRVSWKRDARGFDGWAILELMGHRRLGGHVRVQELAGAPFFRIDVPTLDGKAFATQFYAPGSVYCMTPTTEETARAIAKREQPAPVHLYELQLERRSGGPGIELDEERDEDDFGGEA